MSENPPPSFRQYCHAELTTQGGQEIVTVECQVKDRVTGKQYAFKHAVPIMPIAKVIAAQFAAMSGDTSVAGLGSFLSKAKGVAQKVAANKGIKAVWKKVAPIAKVVIQNYPGGNAALALATKTYDTVKKAKAGDKAALESLKKVASKAVEGNPLASEIMGTAKTLNTMIDMKAGKDPSDMASRIALIERTLNPLLGNPQSSFKAGAYDLIGTEPDDYDYDENGAIIGFSLKGLAKGVGRGIKGAAKVVKKNAKHAIPGYSAYAAIKNPRNLIPGYSAYKDTKSIVNATRGKPARKVVAPRGMPIVAPPVMKPSSRMPGPAPMVPAAYEEELPESIEEELEDLGEEMVEDGYYEDEIQDTISGWREWLYSRPFRSPAGAALQGDFGASTSLRSLYHNGLDTIRGMKR